MHKPGVAVPIESKKELHHLSIIFVEYLDATGLGRVQEHKYQMTLVNKRHLEGSCVLQVALVHVLHRDAVLLVQGESGGVFEGFVKVRLTVRLFHVEKHRVAGDGDVLPSELLHQKPLHCCTLCF